MKLILGWLFVGMLTNSATKISHKDYTHTIVPILTKRSTTTSRANARPGPSYTLSAEVYTDNSDHLPIQWGVCRCVVCKKNCRIHYIPEM